jgi:RNase P subunit RPR2
MSLERHGSLGTVPSDGSVQEESMKPAIDIPSSVSHEPFQKAVRCLRCEQKLDRYQLMRVSLVPNGHGHGHAVLSCPKCGHVEFVSESSPLLQSLELINVDTGDGD